MLFRSLMLAPFGSIVFGALAHGSSTAVAIATAALGCVALTCVAAYTHLMRVQPGVMTSASAATPATAAIDAQSTSIMAAIVTTHAAPNNNKPIKTA